MCEASTNDDFLERLRIEHSPTMHCILSKASVEASARSTSQTSQNEVTPCVHNAAFHLSVWIGGDRARWEPRMSMRQQTRNREVNAADTFTIEMTKTPPILKNEICCSINHATRTAGASEAISACAHEDAICEEDCDKQCRVVACALGQT